MMIVLLALLGISLTTLASDTSESVIFHPVEELQTSKSSWILSTAIDLEPYSEAITKIRHFATYIRSSLAEFYMRIPNDTRHDDGIPKYKMLLNMTYDDIQSTIKRLESVNSKYFDTIGFIRYHPHAQKRSLLPLGGVLSFLFGTADQHDLDELKSDVKALYDNEMEQNKVLNEIVTITNISRGLIAENRLKINNMINSITILNGTLKNIAEQLEPLMMARNFQIAHTEVLLHTHRLKTAVSNIENDVEHLTLYLDTLSSGKLNPSIINPIQLRKELMNI